MVKGHQWDPQDYKKHSAEQQKWARELIGKLALKGNERVLDIGCGDGKVTAEIAARVPQGGVLGVDLSQDMVVFAQKKFPPGDYPNLKFARADASNLGLEPGFNVVFSNATLHWVIDHGPVLQSIARAMLPGGRALLQMGGKGNAVHILQAIDRIKNQGAWRQYFNDMGPPYGFHGPEEYKHWLHGTGLKALRLELIPKTMVFQGAEGLRGWIRTTWLPFTSRLPEELKEDFIALVASIYLDEHPLDEKGRVNLAMVRLEAELIKPV